MTDSTIILIGPMMAGKSTVGELLSERLALPQIALDDIRWDYFDEIGYDHEATKQIVAESGMTGSCVHHITAALPNMSSSPKGKRRPKRATR